MQAITIGFVSFYPDTVDGAIGAARHAGRIENRNAVGTAAAFVCGSVVRFSLEIDASAKKITAVGYQTNGCGFMIAAAEVIATEIADTTLSQLHGLDARWFNAMIDAKLGSIEKDRRHCIDACLEAIQGAFADHRALQIEEFRGEKALICTCFGVAEETIECIIDGEKAISVEKVSELCNAGAGCGSCRMMIQEMIDQRILADHP